MQPYVKQECRSQQSKKGDEPERQGGVMPQPQVGEATVYADIGEMRMDVQAAFV
jgi:hypothetical protein